MEIERKLNDLGGGVFAWTQLPGSWGWSNAGLVTDGDQSLLVDTLFDRRLTADMLAAMKDAAPAAASIGTVVNTHGNGDHCYGNGLVSDAEIIGTQGCVDDLREAPASRNALLMKAGRAVNALGPVGRGLGALLSVVGLSQVKMLADAAPFALSALGEFEFENNDIVLPTRTFSGELDLKVGDKTVRLLEAGPAHTLGDAMVYVPDDRVVFTGDLIFHEAHPVIWVGPIANWVAALERVLELDVDTVVPGHGPITDKRGVEQQLHYLRTLYDETKKRFDAGLPFDDAVQELQLDEFKHWLDAERVYLNVHTIYRELAGDTKVPHVLKMFAGMGRLWAEAR